MSMLSLRYCRYAYDAETGLYYLQSRYYNPSMGRFICADGFTSTGSGVLGANMYAYCNNNPINYTDSLGCYPLQAAIELLATWLKAEDDKQRYHGNSRIVRQLKKSDKMDSIIEQAIDNHKAGNSITHGTDEFIPSEDGYELYLSTQKFSYTITVTEERRTSGILWWKHSEVQYTATVVVHDSYNFDEYREWEGFGNIMNNIAYTYYLLGGGKNYEWYATYTYKTKWTDVP